MKSDFWPGFFLGCVLTTLLSVGMNYAFNREDITSCETRVERLRTELSEKPDTTFTVVIHRETK